jgi:hypothetical protein
MRPLLAKSWLVTKYIAATALLIFAVIMGIGWYVTKSRDEATRSSPFIQKLDQAEREKGNVLKLLFDGLKGVSDDEAQLIVTWLTVRQNRGDQPYLYLIGLYSGKSSDNSRKLQGIEFLAKATLVYRVDALKCSDATAFPAIPILEGAMGMKTVRDSLKTNPELRQIIIAKALEYEDQNKSRQRPEWVCAHGIKPGPQPSEQSMYIHRQAMRTEFEKSF